MSSNRYRKRAAAYSRKPLSKAQVGAVAKVVKSQLNKVSEKKYKTTELANIDADSTPVVTLINPPAQGDGQNSRDGDSLYITSLSGKIRVEVGATNTHVRLILIQWFEDNNVDVPVAADILEDLTTPELAQYNIDNKRKFRVLYDRSFLNNSGAVNTLHLSNFMLSGNKIPMKKMQFNAGATTGVGQFYLLSMGSSADATDTYSAYIRMRYRDM